MIVNKVWKLPAQMEKVYSYSWIFFFFWALLRCLDMPHDNSFECLIQVLGCCGSEHPHMKFPKTMFFCYLFLFMPWHFAVVPCDQLFSEAELERQYSGTMCWGLREERAGPGWNAWNLSLWIMHVLWYRVHSCKHSDLAGRAWSLWSLISPDLHMAVWGSWQGLCGQSLWWALCAPVDHCRLCSWCWSQLWEDAGSSTCWASCWQWLLWLKSR